MTPVPNTHPQANARWLPLCLGVASLLTFLNSSDAAPPGPASPPSPVNKGLVGVGRVPAGSFDKLGDKIDTLGGFFSSMYVDRNGFTLSDGAYQGTIYGLADRGWSLNSGAVTYDYHPRIQTFSFSLKPYYGSDPVPQNQISLVNTASTVLTYDGGKNFTGADSGALPAGPFPTSLDSGPGKGHRSIDSEGLTQAADGGWFVSDEYGPLLYRFNANGELVETFFPPDAYLPKLGSYPGTLNWTGVNPPTSGRRNNRGMEGVTLTPDGKRLVAILQSPLVQDAGRAANSQNSRILEFDIESGSPTYGTAVAEYVYPLSLRGSAANNRQTILSDILAISRERFLVIERDSLGYGTGDTNTPVYKEIVLISTQGATNLINTGYDLERGAPNMVALPTNALPANIRPASKEDLVSLIQESEISRYGLNNRASDTNSITEKWEGLGLISLKDPSFPDDYFLLIGTDNDLTAPVVYHNGVPLATNAAPLDTLIQAWRITLPGVGEPAPDNAIPGIVFTGPTNPTLSAPARVDLTVSAYDQDGKIVKVEFYEGDSKIGEDLTFPFSLRLEGVAAGNHTYKSVCYDNSGAHTETTQIVHVTTENLAPIAAISSPSDASYATSGSALKLSVQSSDPDGYITSVEYFAGAQSLGIVSNAPFNFTWSSVPVGAQTLTAKATDNQGSSTTSPSITLYGLPAKVTAPTATIAGATFSEWSARWWQWAIAQPFNDQHPLKDEIGGQAYRGQSGSVWFLGGAVNASGTVSRKIVLPSGKYLYFPLVNGECSSVEAPPFAGGDTAITLNACAQKFEKTELHCAVDGIPIPGLSGYKILSSIFNFSAPELNFLGVPGPIQGVASDEGYYVMLEPLGPGQHTLQFGGTFGYTDSDPQKSFTFTQNITYEITVLPPGVVAQSQSVEGKTYSEWAAAWYRWDLGNATNRASSIDATGANLPNGQSGNVWFLAGSTVGGKIERNVMIPSSKYLFFPVINIINDYPCPDPTFKPKEGQSLEEFLAEFAKQVIDTTTDFYLELDGVAATDPAPYRAASRLFEFTADPTWGGIDSCAYHTTTTSGVADGLWTMLEPLSAGQHTIRFRAKDFVPGTDAQGHPTLTPFGDQDITYHITVMPTGVLPPYFEVAGKTQAEWSAAWWQWALSQGSNSSPWVELTGANANVHQEGNVFFLAGVLGPQDLHSVTRSFTVPSDKYVFFPIFNSAADNIDVAPPVSQEQLRSWVAGSVESTSNLVATVDGKKITGITQLRQRSPAYSLFLPPHNVFQPLSPGYRDGALIEDAVSDGYWVMLEPLTVGDHSIVFGAAGNGFSIYITNNIKVTAPFQISTNQPYLGKTYGEWGAEWWKWIWSLPYDLSPLSDTTGARGHLGQKGDVWFLVGTQGGAAERSLVIPAGKSLFFPLLNYANDYPCPDPSFKPNEGESLKDFLFRTLNQPLDSTSNLFAIVDGIALTNLFSNRGTSDLFKFTGDISLRAQFDPCITGTEQDGVSDGYWVMLPPLTSGTHTIRLGGSQATLSVDVTYHLTVLPPGILPPYQSVDGVSQQEYSARWWKWASEQSTPVSALKDTTGANANNDQNGSVFFLAGTFGSTDDPNVPAATRHFYAPAGKRLFFPMLNVENDNLTYDPDVSVDQLRKDARDLLANPVRLVAGIDGMCVPNPVAFSLSSPTFSFTLPTDNIYKVVDPRYADGLTVDPAISEGYWLMLEPLSIGRHVLDYGGKQRGGFSTAVRAYITIVPPGIPYITQLEETPIESRLTFWAESGVKYQVQSAPEAAGPYTSEGALIQGSGGLATVSLARTGSQKFYRITQNP